MSFIIQPKSKNISWHNTGYEFIIKVGDLEIEFDTLSSWFNNDCTPVINFNFVNYDIRKEIIELEEEKILQVSGERNIKNRTYVITFDNIGKISFILSEDDINRSIKYYYKNAQYYHTYI